MSHIRLIGGPGLEIEPDIFKKLFQIEIFLKQSTLRQDFSNLWDNINSSPRFPSEQSDVKHVHLMSPSFSKSKNGHRHWVLFFDVSTRNIFARSSSALEALQLLSIQFPFECPFLA